MSRMIRLTRRGFMAACAALGVTSLVGCGGASRGPSANSQLDPTVMFRLSTKGQRASNAAKANAANKLFATIAAAENGRAHPGDRSKVVPLDVSPPTWQMYFQGGQRLAVDLRAM